MTDEINHLADVTLVERRLYQPPQHLFYVHARLWNPAGVARTYLLSDSLSAAGEPAEYDIDVAYVYELTGQGRATVVHFAGSRGFYALILQAGATLELTHLPLEFWGEVPDELAMTIAIGDELKIAGQPVEVWLDIKLQSDQQAMVVAEPLSDQLEVIKSKSVASQDRTAVVLDAAEIVRLAIPL
jgi:hypothetical protein